MTLFSPDTPIDDMPDWAAWLRLHMTPMLGPQTMRRLLQSWGSAQAVLSQTMLGLQSHLNETQAQALQTAPPDWLSTCERIQRWLDQASSTVQHAVWTWGDPAYPAGLLALDDPPPLVFVQGQLQWPCLNSLAIVGSRNPTPQGRENARALAHSLHMAGCCVVSGLALGIDGAAHQGALQSAMQSTTSTSCATVAVVGTGLDQVYPRAHQALARDVAQHGWVLSELPPGTPPMAHHFPRRNRLIAGLSAGVLVVEAAMKSGSLITADLALSQGKEVFAVPGSIHSPLSRGCHALLRQGAKLVETAQDVLEELTWTLQAPLADATDQAPVTLSADAVAVLAALGHDPQPLDMLLLRSGLALAPTLAALHDLQHREQVASMPGGFFQRVKA